MRSVLLVLGVAVAAVCAEQQAASSLADVCATAVDNPKMFEVSPKDSSACYSKQRI